MNTPLNTKDHTFAEMDDAQLVESLRRGEEATFTYLVQQWHGSLVRMALMYVSSYAAAEEVVQDTWLGVLQGLSRFEGRSSLKTWVYRILINRARTTGERESRSVSLSDLWGDTDDAEDPTVDPARFLPPDHPYGPGHWATFPPNWEQTPEQILLSGETAHIIRQAILALPASQQEVITLRDVEGWSAEEVCNILVISETNQRVLLHRARAKVRQALEEYLARAQKP